jgi:hypothetical protein
MRGLPATIKQEATEAIFIDIFPVTNPHNPSTAISSTGIWS